MITHPLTFAQALQPRQKGIPPLWLLSICALGLSLSASAQKATFTTFDPPGSAGTFSTSINPAGAITGYYATANNIPHAFLRSRDGTFTMIDFPGARPPTPQA
jgi:hypothetical protein